MASGGKHLKKQANNKRGSGAHLSEKDRQRAARRRSRSANRRGRLRRGAPQMIVMLPHAKRPLPMPVSLRKRQRIFRQR